MDTRLFSFNPALGWSFLVVGLVGMMLSSSALAQPRGGGGMSLEDRVKVDAVQAAAVASALELDAEMAEKLTAAYGEYRKKSAENRPEGGGRGDREAMRTFQEEQQNKLAAELKNFLGEPQAKAAAEILGGSNRGWDRLVQVILGFGLESAKESEALGHTLTYVKAGAKARKAQGDSRDFEAMRTAMQTAKTALDTSVAPLLTEVQKAEWSEKTEWGGRGGRGGRRGEGDRGGRGRRGDN